MPVNEHVGDHIFQKKVDIGMPGSAGGLDVGEGGSYQDDKDGTRIVQAFQYDASAVSGSRFTELTLDASNTWLGDAGDRVYIGSTKQFWAARFNFTTAKTTELLQAGYWNGSALTNTDHMVIRKDTADNIGDGIGEQTAEKEYVTWDHDVDDDWAAADDVTDKIPNGASSMFWIYFQVPVGDLATAPVTNEIRVRGSDTDVITGTAFQVWWGHARVEVHERIPLNVTKSPGGTGTTNVAITSGHSQTLLNFNGVDDTAWVWVLPEGIDTSTRIHVKLDYIANAADTFTLVLTAKRLKNATAVSSSESDDYTSSTDVVAAAADTFYSKQELAAVHISIQDLAAEDAISFELARTDTGNAIFPVSVTIHYSKWTTGEHV